MITKKQEYKILSAIIEMECEMTLAVSEGHKPVIGDMFQEYRNQLERLRSILFNTEFIGFCNMNKLHPLDDGFSYDEYLNAKEHDEDELRYNQENNS
jgi:hypothetical protein